MSSEFKIKTSVDLDTKEAKQRLEKLQEVGEKNPVKLKAEIDGLSKFNNQVKQLQGLFNKAFKIDSDTTKGLKTIESTMKQINKLSEKNQNVLFSFLGKDGLKASEDLDKLQKKIIDIKQSMEKLDSTSGGIGQNELVKQYTDIYNTVEKLKKLLRDDISLPSFFNVTKDIDDLEGKMKTLKSLMTDSSLSKIEFLDFKKSNKEIVQLTNEFEGLQQNISKVGKELLSLKVNPNTDLGELKELEKNLENLQKISKEDIKADIDIQNAKSKVNELFTYISMLNDKNKKIELDIKSEQSNLVSQYKDITAEVTKLQKQLDKGLDMASAERTSAQLDQLKNKLKEIYSSLNESSKKDIDLFNSKKALQDLTEYNTKVNKVVSETNKALSELGKAKGSGYTNTRIADLKSEVRELQELCSRSNEINIDTGQAMARLQEITQEAKNLTKIADLEGKFDPSILKEYNSDIERLVSSAKNLDTNFTGAFKGLETSLSGSQKEFNALNREISNGKKTMDDFLSSLSAYTLGDILADGITDALRGIKDIFMEIDKGMANVKKVADPSDIDSIKELNNIKDSAINIAKDVGMASGEVMNAIADTLQAGVGGMQESIAVARQAMILANVGDMTQEASTSALNTVINGFKLNPLKEFQLEIGNTVKVTTELQDAMDKLNFAGNNYAIGTDGVAEAMKRGGTVLHEYGVSLSDTIGLITATNEAIQNPEKVGNGLKSVAINLAGMKANAKDGTLELNKTAKTLREIANIDVYSDKSKGQVKDMVQIMDELKDKWDTLKQNEQLTIAEAVAGKHQASIFQSLMGNYETFKQIQSEFAQGLHFGSAERENSTYVESLSGKLNKLKETWTSIMTTVVTSDMTKGILDFAINVSEGIESVVKILDKFNISLPVTVGLVSTLINTFKTFSSKGKPDLGFINTLMGISDFNYSGITTFTNTLKETGSVSKSASASVSTLSGIIKKSGVASKLGSLGLSLLNGALISLAIGGITFAIKKWDEYNKRFEIMAEKKRESIETIRSETQELNKQKESLSGIAKEYDTLASKSDKTAQETERFAQLKDQIADAMPELVVGYDSNNDPILAMNGTLSDMIANLDKAIERKNELMKSEQNSLAITGMENAKKETKDIEKLQDKLKKQIKEGDASWNGVTVSGAMWNQQFSDRIKALGKAYEQEELLHTEKRQKIIDALEKYNQTEQEIQQRAFNLIGDESRFKNYTSLADNLKNQVNSMMGAFNWHDINSSEQNKLVEGFDKLSVAVKDGKFNITEFSKEWQKINTSFQATGDVDAYTKNLEGLANQLQQVTGVDASLWLKGLEQAFEGLDYAQTKLSSFLEGYGSSLDKLQSGDSLAIALKGQFDALNDLINEFSMTGNIDIKLLTNLINSGEIKKLPSEIQSLIKGVVADGEVVDIEKKLLLSISTAIKEEGSIPKEVQEKLSKLMNGGKLDEQELKVPIQISDDIRISSQELVELQKYYKKNPVKVDFESKTDEILKDLEEVQTNLDGLKNQKIRLDVESKGLGKTKEEVSLLNTLLENIPDEKQSQFIVETGNALQGVTTVEEAMKKIPDYVKLQYNIGVEGNERLEALKSAIEVIPKEQRTKFTANTEGVDKLTHVKDLIDQFGKEKTTKLLVDNSDALFKAKSVEDFLNNLPNETKKTLGITVEGVEEAKKSVDELNKKTDEVNGKEVTTKVNKKEITGAVEDIKTFVDMSAKVKDGEYKLDINANTEGAVNNLKALEKQAKETMDALSSGDKKTTISISTSTASQNITGLRKNIESYKTLTSSIKKVVFSTDTATGSKNVTGLKNNVKGYVDKYSGKTIKTTFSTVTALASKNVTGLKKNVSGYVSSYGGKTFTTTFKVVTKYETQGTPTPQSQGAKVKRSIPTPVVSTYQTINENVGRETLDMQRVARVGESGITPEPLAVPRVSPRATSPTPIAITGGDIGFALENSIELLKELDNRIKIVTNSISLLDKKMKNASGKDKLEYLKQQIALYKEQQRLLTELEDKYIRQANYSKYYLEKQGFKFNADGNMTNYEEKLMAMEKEAKRLEQIANKDKATDSQKKAYENYKTKLDNVKKHTEEYINLTFTELPKLKEEWIDYADSIKEATYSIKDIEREQALYSSNAKLKDLEISRDRISDEKELLNLLMNNAPYEEKMQYQKQYLDLLYEEQKVREEQIASLSESLGVYQGQMSEFGFKFNDMGDITNLQDVLLKYQNSPKDLEYINKLVDEYIKIQREELPNINKEWIETNNNVNEVTNSIKDLNSELAQLRIDALFKSMNKQVTQYNHELKKIDTLMENAFGVEKEKLLKEKVELLNKQIAQFEKMKNYSQKVMSDTQKQLQELGFTFRENGDIINYNSHIVTLKESGKDYETAEQLVSQYLDMLVNKIPEYEQSILDINNDLLELQWQLIETNISQDNFAKNNALKQLNNEYDKLADRLDIIGIKIKNAYGEDKLKLIEEQIKLLKEQQKVQQGIIFNTEAMLGTYQKELGNFGVKFDKDGNITNLEETLNKFKDNSNLEKLTDLIDEYIKLQGDELPDAVKEWEKLESAIKDAHMNQLNTTKEIEDKITQMYKKQIEERIKLMEKETDEKIKNLKKQKDAYNKSREEADYQRDYEDQLETVMDIQKQLEIAQKDSSVSGQKKVQELLKQLKEEQRKLEDLVQDKIDSDVNDMFDEEMDRLDKENQEAIENLENEWSDSKIAEMVAQALGSGVFTDIEGNVTSLEDALLKFCDESGESFGVLGEVIKNELIANLEVAKNTVENLGQILGGLDLDKIYGNSKAYQEMINPNYNSKSVTNNVSFDSPLIVVEGNVTSDVIPDLERIIEKAKNQITQDIVAKIN